MVTETVNMQINYVREKVEENTVSIADAAGGYGDWEPDLRVDPRLGERLVKAVELMRADPDFGPGFMLPVSSCYRPLLGDEKGYTIRDARDPRGHWSGLAIDVGYRNVLPEHLWKKFIKYFKQAGLYRIHLQRYKEWWHFSRWGVPYKEWRAERTVHNARGRACRTMGVL
ncbi:MAG: hypothetical protein GY771_14050 [bacterium]|nr:hypothetical protein [bacterium]